MKEDDYPVVLFDGVCNLCNSSVQFIIKNDKKGRFRFAPLQSDFAQQLLSSHNFSSADSSSVVLVENGKVYTQSQAVLRIARRLDGIWPAFYIFKIVPASIRNRIYNWVAANRYRWFGKKDACMIPTPELRARFLETS